MFASIGLLFGAVPGFFLGVYLSSRSKTALSTGLWAMLSMVCLVCIAVATIQIAVPNFFSTP